MIHTAQTLYKVHKNTKFKSGLRRYTQAKINTSNDNKILITGVLNFKTLPVNKCQILKVKKKITTSGPVTLLLPPW